MIELHNFKWAHRKIEQAISFYQSFKNHKDHWWFNSCFESRHKLISKWVKKIHKDLGMK